MDSFSSDDPASGPLSRRRSMGNRRFDRYAAVLSPAPQRPARSDEPRLNWKNDVDHHPEDDNANALPLHSSTTSSTHNQHHHQYQHHNHNHYQNLRRFDRDHDYDHDLYENHSDPLVPSSPNQQTTPPRWDSLSAGASPISSPTTFASFLPALGSLSLSSSHRSRAESPTPASRAPPRSAFPGLCSNPFIPEDESLDQFASDVPLRARQFPLGKNVGEPVASSSSYQHQYPAPNVVDGRSIPPKSPSDGSMTVENFSRPRKPSVRSQRSETLSSRQLHSNRLQHDSTADHQLNHQNSNLNSAPSPWSRTRGLSTSSSKSSSTFASSIQPSSVHHQPSYDQLGPASRTGSLRGAPAPTSAPHSFSRPPLTTSHTPLAREPPPWLTTGDEIRSSVRSQLSVSTAQGTLFTGTERSSVLTKTSSITEHSIINGYARNSWRTNSVVADDGPSLEDVMGMYERGFDDSDMESVHRSIHFREDDEDFAGGMTLEVSRPASSHSNMSAVGARMLEAMNDQLPLPGALAVPTPNRSSVRESRSSFRKSLLPSSLPKDLGLGLDGYMARRARNASQDMGKHDSGKMLDAEDDLPPPHGSSHSSPSALGTVVTPIAAPVQAQPFRPTTPAPRPTEPPEDPTSRDRYGFRKASANVTREEYDAWESTYSDYLERRRKKWVAYHKDNSLMTDHPIRFPPRNNKTKRFIRKGIPPDWRGAAWFYYAGGPAILSKHRGVYDELVKRAALDPRGPGSLLNMTTEVKTIVVEDIEKDLHRTFPDNVRFKPPRSAEPETPKTDPETGKTPETEIITSLRRVLHAFAIYNPRIGYCQSLNFLAGFLLLFVETEEQAFWLLNVITRVYLPGTHEMSLEGSKVDLGVLMQSLKDSLPAVWRQIGGDELDPHPTTKRFRPRRGTTKTPNNGTSKHAAADADPNRLPAITLCMTAWFMSCFIGTLPTETVLRVWDVFFYEGSRTLFRIALAVFKLAETEIKAVADPMEMFGVVQAFPRRLVDCNALMDACYRRRNGIGHLSQDAVEERRRERRDGIRRWRAEQEVAAQGGEGGMAGLDLAGEFERTKKAKASGGAGSSGTSLFGRRKERDLEQVRAQEVM